MPYDFDTVIERRGTNASKWQVGVDELPLTVADMDFVTAPAVAAAVQAKASAGVFGYGVVPEEFAVAVSEWWTRRYGWAIDTEWVQYCTGVVPAISSLLRTFAEAGDGVVVQSPCYNEFYSVIEDCGRTVVANDLVYADGRFHIDWADLEAKLARAKVFLLCNPQNPTGQIFSTAELARMGELARQYDVLVIADEIHCDITAPGVSYTPYGVANPGGGYVALVSPTKSFNIPGLTTAAMVVEDSALRERCVAALVRDRVTEPGAFSIEATIAAYGAGEEWLEELRAYVWANKRYLETSLAEALPQVRVVPSEATYVSWLDCTLVSTDADDLCRHLRETTGLIANPGSMYGANTVGFIRLNLACPRVLLEEGLARFVRGIGTFAGSTR